MSNNDEKPDSRLKPPSAADTNLVIDSCDSQHLVPGARIYFADAVRNYAEQLFTEAKGIEKLEHTGDGPPEITAAYVEEAKWVLLRRLRRRSKSTCWLALLRTGQFLSSAGMGIGASNFAVTWGSVMCLVSVLLGSMFLFVEREIGRDI
jgi:hypothetical protein